MEKWEKQKKQTQMKKINVQHDKLHSDWDDDRVRDMLRDLTDIKNKQLFLQSNRCRITDDATRGRGKEKDKDKKHHP